VNGEPVIQGGLDLRKDFLVKPQGSIDDPILSIDCELRKTELNVIGFGDYLHLRKDK